MGGKASLADCPLCKSHRPIRKSSGLCYCCHWHHNVLPKMKIDESVLKPSRILVDEEEIEELKNRDKVIKAFHKLYSAWRNKDLDLQESSSWELIEAVEDLLGKE